MKYKCFDCRKDFDKIKRCEECGVYLCEDCFIKIDYGICEECGYEEDGIY